jgi:hypothetical protein
VSNRSPPLSCSLPLNAGRIAQLFGRFLENTSCHAPSRVQKLATNEFRRLTIDASAAELKQEKSLVAELGI